MAKTAPLNLSVPLLGFCDWDDRAFLTKGGDVGMVVEVDGIDPSCLPDREADSVADSYEMAIANFDERTIWQQHYLRQQAELNLGSRKDGVSGVLARSRENHFKDRGLWSDRIYNVVLRLDPRAQRSLWKAYRAHDLRSYFKRRKNMRLYYDDVVASHEQLARKTEGFVEQMSGTVRMRVLRSDEVFQLLRRLLNFDRGLELPEECGHCGRKAAVISRQGVGLCESHGASAELAAIRSIGEIGKPELGYEIACSHVATAYDHLRVGHHLCSLASFKIPRRAIKTFPQMFADLQRIEGSFHLMLEWQALDLRDSSRLMTQRQEHFAAAAGGQVRTKDGVSYATLTKPENVRAQKDVEEVQDRLAQSEYLGNFSAIAAAHARDEPQLRRTEGALKKVFLKHGIDLVTHIYNQPELLFARIPGGYRSRRHRWQLANSEISDLTLWSRSHEGRKRNAHLASGPLIVMRTRSGSRFNFHLHGPEDLGLEDMANAFAVGRMGAGKTVLMGEIVASLDCLEPKPRIVCLDVDGSFEGVVKAAGGEYMNVSEDGGMKVNPFARPLTRRHAGFLVLFLRTLIESNSQRITRAENRSLHAAIRGLYRLPAEMRTLTTLAGGLSLELRRGLEDWTGSGQYAAFFDNVTDSVTEARVQCWNLEKSLPDELVEPCSMWALRQFDEAARDDDQSATVKALFMDEAAVLLRRKYLQSYAVSAARGLRKRNGFVFLMTQLLDDLQEDQVAMKLAKMCTTRLYFSQPSANGDYSNMGLSAEEVEEIRKLARGEFLLKQGPGRGTVVDSFADPALLALCRTDAPTRKRRASLFEKYGAARGLEQMLREEER